MLLPPLLPPAHPRRLLPPPPPALLCASWLHAGPPFEEGFGGGDAPGRDYRRGGLGGGGKQLRSLVGGAMRFFFLVAISVASCTRGYSLPSCADDETCVWGTPGIWFVVF